MTNRFFWALGLSTILPVVAVPLLLASDLLHHDAIWPTANWLFMVAGAHILSTLWFHADADYAAVRKSHPWRMILALFAIPAVLVAVSLTWPAMMTPLMAGYMAWQAHHYSRQNFGILSFASAHDKFGKLPVSVSHFVTATTFIGAPGMITWVGAFGVAPIFDWWTTPFVFRTAQLISVAALLVSGAMLVRLILTEPNLRRSPTLVTFLVLTWIFYVPVLTAVGMEGAFMPYAVAHGLQYLVFMTVTAGRSRVGPMGAVLMLGGTIGLVTLAGRLPVALYAPIWTGLVVWHFVADARLWRMSDPSVRAVVTKRFDFVFRGRQAKPALAPAE